MRKLLFTSLFLLLLICLEAQDNLPTINNHMIVFSNGKTYSIQENWGPFESNNLGIRFYREKVNLIQKWKTVILFQDFRLNEGSAGKLIFLNYAGEIINESDFFSGRYDIQILVDHEVVFFISKISSNESKSSYIFNRSGIEEATFYHNSEIMKSGTTSDGNYVWLISRIVLNNKVGDSIPGTRVEVFDFSGERIFEDDVAISGSYAFVIDNHEYQILLPKPELPG